MHDGKKEKLEKLFIHLCCWGGKVRDMKENCVLYIKVQSYVEVVRCLAPLCYTFHVHTLCTD